MIPNPGFSDLTTMEAGRGDRVEMNESSTMIVTGLVPSNSTGLVNGSNLVGQFGQYLGHP